jgi:cytochrome P450
MPVTADAQDLRSIDVSDPALWVDGPPHALFARLRREAPVHWSPLGGHPDEAGFWSITRAKDIRDISLNFQAFSSERGGIMVLDDFGIPLEAQQQMMIAQDPPRHDRLKALFQRGFAPRRIAEHEDRIREIVTRTLDAVAQRGECDLVHDVASPVVSRVIGSFIGSPPEEDAENVANTNLALGFGDDDLRPDLDSVAKMMEGSFKRVQARVADRRVHPRDDLYTVLAHAEVDGEVLNDFEIFMGIGLLGAAGNDSTRSTYTNGMLELMTNPEQRRLLLDEPSLIPQAVEECLRCFPAFAHFRRTATRDVELHGETIREGDKVLLWYVASNRDESNHTDPDRFDVTRTTEHQAFGAGGRHYCLGVSLARLELRLLFEETLRRFPDMELAGEPTRTQSVFLNQLKTLPVRFTPEAA